MISQSSIALLLLALAVESGLAAAPVPPARPNIVVILGDDIGYSDLGCYGGEIATPHLDGLAAGGLRFTQFYNTARCCPTRASLLTGLHPHQAGVGHMMNDQGYEGYRGRLNRRCVTIAEALQPAGYRSYAVGKWHVTPGQSSRALADSSNWPLQRGFARFYGTIHGAGSYFDPSSLVRDNTLITVANDPDYRPVTYYYTDAIAEHSVRFIRDHARTRAGEPFFLYVAFTAAHWPLHAKEADTKKYKGRYDTGYEPVRAARLAKMNALGLIDPRWTPASPAEKWADVKDKAFESRCMEVYAAQLDSMDQGIGRILAELKAHGQFENTLIFYLQDNGGCAEGNGRRANADPRADRPTLPPMNPDDPQFDSMPSQTRDGWPVRQGIGVMPGGPDTYIAYGRGWANVSNTPFREYKHWTHEGGISTPLIVHWPAGISNPKAAAASPKPAAGRLVREPGQLVDIMATCLDVAGARYPAAFRGERIAPPEGRSLKPLFAPFDDSNARSATNTAWDSRFLYWEHEGNRAIREGKWKLVATENHPWELYDIEADRPESRNLASSEPARVKAMSEAWDAWAARAQVLPLGGWRGRESSTNFSRETRFTLKAGDRLERSQAPAIAGRSFTITAGFDAGPESTGVIVAQGGSGQGYSLYLSKGHLHFAVRGRSDVREIQTPLVRPGMQSAIARLNPDGTLSLALNNGTPAITKPAGRTVGTSGLIASMPGEGLDVGRDDGSAVGSYKSPNPFTGTVRTIAIELSPRPAMR